MCSSSPPTITEQAHPKSVSYQTVEKEWTGNLTKSLSSCLRPCNFVGHGHSYLWVGPRLLYNQLVMKSGEGREVESGGVIPVYDMCSRPVLLPTPGHVSSTHHIILRSSPCLLSAHTQPLCHRPLNCSRLSYILPPCDEGGRWERWGGWQMGREEVKEVNIHGRPSLFNINLTSSPVITS